MDILETIFETTAVFNSKQGLNGGYQHFGICSISASLYGDKPEDIVKLNFKISSNQERTDKTENKDNDYWGFYEPEKERFTLIYPKYFLLDMCFPCGIKGAENANQGKAYRIEFI